MKANYETIHIKFIHQSIFLFLCDVHLSLLRYKGIGGRKTAIALHFDMYNPIKEIYTSIRPPMPYFYSECSYRSIHIFRKHSHNWNYIGTLRFLKYVFYIWYGTIKRIKWRKLFLLFSSNTIDLHEWNRFIIPLMS